MDDIEIEIRNEYKRMNRPLAEIAPFTYGKRFNALSQYGYPMNVYSFETKELAEQYAMNFYRNNMNLIRQG